MFRGLSDDLLPIARKQIRVAYEDTKERTDSIYSDLFVKNRDDENKIILKEIYENYTAALGMIVNQSGFQTAIAIYSEDKSQSEGKRAIILNLLFEMLKSKKMIEISNLEAFQNKVLDGECSSVENYEDLFKEASIALKRAIRTYEINK